MQFSGELYYLRKLKKKKQINAHKNLGELGIRMALHAKRTRDEKFILPSDGYTISRWEK